MSEEPAPEAVVDDPDRPERFGSIARRASAHPVLATVLVGIPVAIYNIWWISRHRLQGGFDGDEAGYLATSLRMNRALFDGGVGDYLHLVINNHRSGPLLPALSALIVVPGREIASMMALQPLFHLLSAVAIAGIGARLGGRRAGLVSGLVALGYPGALVMARSYQLVPSTIALLALATWALLASDRCRSTPHLLAAGAAVGGMLVSRTMAVAFLPGLAVAGLLLMKPVRRSILNVISACAVVLAVAGPWWIHEWSRSIYPYLTRYGYGQGAGDLGPSSPPLRAAVRLGLLLVSGRPLLLLPALIVLIVALARILRRIRNGPGRITIGRIITEHREVVAVAAIVVVAWSALLSSSNIGTWFQLPLEMLAIPLVVGVGAHLGPSVRSRLGPMVVAAALLNVALMSNWTVGASTRIGDGTLSMLTFGGVEFSQAIDFEAGDPRFAPDSPQGDREQAMREWAAALNEAALHIDALTPPGGAVMQTVVGDVRLVQATTLDLAELLTGRGRNPWEAPSARSTIGDGTVSVEPFAGDLPRLIVAIDAGLRDPQEGFSPAEVIERSDAAGWKVARRVALPDGGDIILMTHPDSLPGG